MKSTMHKTTAAFIAAVFAFTLFLAPSPAKADWDDRSDELPGFADLTPVLVIGGVLVAASVVLLIHKHNSKNKAAEQKPADQVTEKKSEPVSDPVVAPYAPHQRKAVTSPPVDTTAATQVVPEKDSRLNFYIGLTNDKKLYRSDEPAMDLSDYSVRAGLTFGF